MKLSHVLKILLHVMLWVGYFLLQYYFLSFPFDSRSALILSARVVMIHALLFYVNSYLLLPKFLDKSRYVFYFLSVLLLLAACYLLFTFSHELSFIREAFETSRYRRMRNVPNLENAFRTRFFINNLISSLAVLFISTTYWIINRAQQRKQLETNLINEKLQTEMKFLKSQVNPHFLLNALNNIYSLANLRSEKTPEMIYRLAGMLKYVLYGANAKMVTLGQEISYIEDYVAFQKLKFEHEPAVHTDFTAADREIYLAPMLLIPFIENSFKHSDLEEKAGFVNISISTTSHSIHLKLENNIEPNGNEEVQNGGIGLNNAKRRLNLLYPDTHSLRIEQKNNIFMVDLTLDTQ